MNFFLSSFYSILVRGVSFIFNFEYVSLPDRMSEVNKTSNLYLLFYGGLEGISGGHGGSQLLRGGFTFMGNRLCSDNR